MKFLKPYWRVCLFLFFLAGLLFSNSYLIAGPRYEYRLSSSPDGTGKFYYGREIARYMSYRGAAWLERSNRDEEERTTSLLAALGIRSGDTVADIGAGSGFFTFQLAEIVGEEGRVLAVDIQQQMLDLIRERKEATGSSNIELILGDPVDPRLPPASVDLVLMVDVYHEFSHPWEMMKAICWALKDGGQVAFVEYRAEDRSVPIKPLHKMSEAQVRKEMEGLPLRWVKTFDKLPWQHVIFFEKLSTD